MSGDFDRIAPFYRWMEYLSFGPFLERCRFAQLRNAGKPRRALVLGDGDGRFLARLLATYPTLTADVVDSSASMLRLLDRRIRRMRRTGEAARCRIELHPVDALEWQATGVYDLVVGHFFLDCFFPAEIDAFLDRLTPHLASNAQWIISEFSIPGKASGGGTASYVRSKLASGVVSFLYRCFGLITGLRVRELPAYAPLLRKRGWRLERETQFLGGLLQSQLWQLHAIRCITPSTDGSGR